MVPQQWRDDNWYWRDILQRGLRGKDPLEREQVDNRITVEMDDPQACRGMDMIWNVVMKLLVRDRIC